MASTVCPNCGLALNAGDAFCGGCGRPVNPAGPPTMPAQPITTSPGSDGQDAVSLPGPLADSYEVGLTMSYDNVSKEPSFDPLRNRRFAWQLLRRFLLWQAVPWIIGIITGIVAAIARSAGVLTVIPIVWVVAVLLFVFLPIPGLLAQWSRLVPFAADAQGVAFDHIRQALAAHATPNDTIDIQNKLIPGEGVQHYLRLKHWIFSGFISCFQHGHDLYVGWTFWIYTSPFQVGLMWIGRRFQDRTGRGNEMYQTLRYDSTRATIAALHACTLEGIDSAIRATGPAAREAAGASLT
jgi:hypothetical protein